jgi:acetyl esterase/lipase
MVPRAARAALTVAVLAVAGCTQSAATSTVTSPAPPPTAAVSPDAAPTVPTAPAPDPAPMVVPAAFINRERHDVAYATTSMAQHLDLWLPPHGEGPFPVVVWIHGGGWDRGDKAAGAEDLIATLTTAGYAVASLNYRLSPEAVFPAQLTDVKAAVRYLRANAASMDLDTQRIGAWGDSAGGHLAAMLGTTADVPSFDDATLGNDLQSSRVQAVVDWYGPASFDTFDAQLTRDGCTKRIANAGSLESRLVGSTIGTNRAADAAASPTTYVSADDPPFFIEHGQQDCIVPWQQSEQLANELRTRIGNDNVTLTLFAHADHGGADFHDPANLARIVAFFDHHLR